MPKLLILDFDGTMTDAEQEGAPYRTGYIEDLALLADRSLEEISTWAQEFSDRVNQRPQEYGWKFGGQIVAPACVDPYLRVMPIARMVLDRAEAFQDENERDRILDRILYKYNYQKTITSFRNRAKEFLMSCHPDSSFTTYIVTNSHTEPVTKKVEQLGAQEGQANQLDWLLDRVHGSAKKYIIDNDFVDVPEHLNLPGLTRPILLRRKHYYQVLNSLRTQVGVEWSDVIVLGDIFELDLCLPFEMGAHVGLMKTEFSPQYEVDFLDQHERGATFFTLDEAADWLQTSHT
jgi:hypothetical protein